MADPLFNRDVGFFVFKLPLYEWVATSLTSLVLLVTVLTGLCGYEGDLPGPAGRAGAPALDTSPPGQQDACPEGHHLLPRPFPHRIESTMTSLEPYRCAWDAAVLGWPRCSVCCRDRHKVLTRMDTDVTRAGYVLAGVIGLVIIGKAAYPAVLQYVTVRPRQLTAEKPFIERSIKFTRQAYLLDQINVRDYDIVDQLSAQDLEDNRDTVDSVRLWDHRPLLTAYGQEEQIAPYYAFTDIDLDRYRVNGRLRQVALGTRSCACAVTSQARHGSTGISYPPRHGIAMSPVNGLWARCAIYWFWHSTAARGDFPEAMDLKRPAVYSDSTTPERAAGHPAAQACQANRQTASERHASVGRDDGASGGGGQRAQPRLGPGTSDEHHKPRDRLRQVP